MSSITSALGPLLFVAIALGFQLSATSAASSLACDEPAFPVDSMTAKIQTCSDEDTSACRLNKGRLYQLELQKIKIASNTNSVELQILLKFPPNADNGPSYKEVQVPDLDGDLCDGNNPNGHFPNLRSVSSNATNECYFPINSIQILPGYNFTIPLLFPSGEASIKFLLLGSEGPLACSMIETELIE